MPILPPACAAGEHRDEITNLCQSNDVCLVTPTCSDGAYSETFKRCICNDASYTDYTDPCDASCQANLLEVYYESQAISIVYPNRDVGGTLTNETWEGIPESEFPTMFFAGLNCEPGVECRLRETLMPSMS